VLSITFTKALSREIRMSNYTYTGEKTVKRVRLYLTLNPQGIVEGALTIPGEKARLSDVINDDRNFLALQDVLVVNVEGWPRAPLKFLLLNKREIKAIMELED
jgi:hypothetical protein